MKTRLTLWVDEELVREARLFARESGTSLSALVAGYLARVTSRAQVEPPVLSPRVRRMAGGLRAADVDEEDYQQHLLKRAGLG